jgi:hypothetical protein
MLLDTVRARNASRTIPFRRRPSLATWTPGTKSLFASFSSEKEEETPFFKENEPKDFCSSASKAMGTLRAPPAG